MSTLALTIPGTDLSLDLVPALPWWLLLPALGIALGLIIWLYWAQRRIAPARLILLLTLLRAGLVGLMLLMLLQPVIRWTQTRHSAGTLWLLLDQSPSMGSRDAQATDLEKLRWADELGFISPSTRRVKPDLDYAAIACLRADFLALQPSAGAVSSGTGADAARIRGFAEDLRKWATALRDLIARLQRAPDRAETALSYLRAAQQELGGAPDAARSATSLRQASEAVRWPAIRNSLKLAADEMREHARVSDETFLGRHRKDISVAAGLGRVTGLSRADLATQMLTASAQRGHVRLQDVLERFRTRVASFSDGATIAPSFDASSPQDTFATALTINGRSTNIAAGLQMIGEQLGPEEPAAVVIITDGRHNAPADPTDAARLLAARGVRVHALLVGSEEVSPDAAVDDVNAPEWIYKDDTMRATALVRLDGIAGQKVQIEFRRNDLLRESRILAARGNSDVQKVEFTDKPGFAQSHEYTIKVSEVPGESDTQNNRRSFRVAVKKDKLHALMIDDQPRWEWRYLRSYLGRESPLKLQSVLLSPLQVPNVGAVKVRASPTNRSIDAQLLPETRDDWFAYDLIILGDVGPNQLDAQTQQIIAAAVRDRGTTLVLVAGANAMPEKLAGMPLADLLPVTLTSPWATSDLARHLRSGFRPTISPDGATSVLAQFGLEGPRVPLTGPVAPVGLTWYWHSPYTAVKPSATCILYMDEAEPVGRHADLGTLADMRKKALLSTMNVGLGKVAYIASDQTWRWRNLHGEDGHDRFWGQLVRWAVGSDLPAGGKYVRFGTNRPRYAQGDPITVTARVFREDLVPYSGLNFSAVAKPVAGRAGTTNPAPGAPASAISEARFVETPEAPGYYRATLGGLPAGDVEITLRGAQVERLLEDDPSASSKSIVITITPQLNLEQRNMNTDRATLARITDAGGGATVDASAADILASHLPAIQHTFYIPQQVGLFSDPKNRYTAIAHWTFLGLFATLITAEWLLRKRGGMI